MSNSTKLEHFLSNREIAGFRSGIVRTHKADFEEHEFCQKDVREHTGCVNSLKFSHNERLLASGGDDLHSRVWEVDELVTKRAPKPAGKMTEPHASNIFSIDFDLEDRFLFSGERWGSVFKHDIQTKQMVYKSRENSDEEDVYHLHQNPSDNNMLAVTRSHLISFLDDRDRPNPTSFRPLEPNDHKYYTAEYHPRTACLLLVNSKTNGPNIYDLRMALRPVYKRNYDAFRGAPIKMRHSPEWMGSMWSPSGNQFFSLRNGAAPIYFDLIGKRCFHLHSESYLNIKTLKSMTFIDDQTVATGSDRCGIHVWKLPHSDQETGFIEMRRQRSARKDLVVENEIKILRGHRSIPNQVRFSSTNQLLVSSGVENIVKLWSHRRLPWSYDVPFERRKRGRFDDVDTDEEIEREREKRTVLETELDEVGEMDGRATWDDVFGGNVQTSEDRGTVEMFDVEDSTEDSFRVQPPHFNAGLAAMFRGRNRRVLLQIISANSDEEFPSDSDEEDESDDDEMNDEEQEEFGSSESSEVDYGDRNDDVDDVDDDLNNGDDDSSVEGDDESDGTVSEQGAQYLFGSLVPFVSDDDDDDDDSDIDSGEEDDVIGEND